MSLTMSHLISKPLVQYMDTYGLQIGEFYSLQVQALLDSCHQRWFCHVPPVLSRVLLQHIATMSPLDELPWSCAVLSLDGGPAEAEYSSSDRQKVLAYAPFQSFVTAITELAGSKTGKLPTSPLKMACLTWTALLQSALLASKLLACTENDPSIPHDKTHFLPSVVVNLVVATAKHISISQWVEDELVDGLPMWLVQSCLQYLRQIIRNHQQCRRSHDDPDAARASMKLLTSLLRPSTQVAALVIEAMYSSGCVMALVTIVQLELDTYMEALELLCTAVTLATSDSRHQILTLMVRLDVVECFDNLLYAPITDADSEDLIGSQCIGFSPVETSEYPTCILEFHTQRRVQNMKATARLMLATLQHMSRDTSTDSTKGVASGTTSGQAGLAGTDAPTGNKVSSSETPSSSGAIDIGSTTQSQSALGIAEDISTDSGWDKPGWDPIAEKHLRLSMILLTAKNWLQRLLLDGLHQDLTLVHADASSAVSELLRLLLKYQLKDLDFASNNLAKLFRMGTALVLDSCLQPPVPDPLLDDWLDRLVLDKCLQSVYLLDDGSRTFHAMRRGLNRLWSEDGFEVHLASLNAVYVILDSAANISYLDRHAAPLIQADVLEYVDGQLEELQLDNNAPDCDQMQLATYFTAVAILARLRGRALVTPETSAALQELEDGPFVGRIFAYSMKHIAMISSQWSSNLCVAAARMLGSLATLQDNSTLVSLGAALWPQGTKAQKEQRNILDSVLTLSIDTVKLSDNRSIFIPFFIAPLATLLHAFLCCPQNQSSVDWDADILFSTIVFVQTSKTRNFYATTEPSSMIVGRGVRTHAQAGFVSGPCVDGVHVDLYKCLLLCLKRPDAEPIRQSQPFGQFLAYIVKQFLAQVHRASLDIEGYEGDMAAAESWASQHALSMGHDSMARPADSTTFLEIIVALHQSIGWQLTPSHLIPKDRKHPEGVSHEQITCGVLKVLYNLAAELHLTMAASKKVKLSRGASPGLLSAHKKRQGRIQHLRTQLETAAREAWQLANAPAWQGLFEAQREGVWCEHDPRQEALARHVQALVQWKALPSDCLASIHQLFFIPPVSSAAAEQAAADLLDEEQAEVAKADAKKAKKLRQKLKKQAKQAEEPGSSHSLNSAAEHVTAGPDRHAFAEAACQHGQHISHQTATPAHNGQQQKQGLQCKESLENLGPQLAACTAASNAINIAADSADGNHADSAASSSTVGMRVADCSACAKSPVSDAAHAAVPAVSSQPCADTDRSAIRTAAAAAGREPSISNGGTHATEGKPAGAADAHAEEKLQKRCGRSLQGVGDLDLSAGNTASKRHTLLGKAQFRPEVAVHSSNLAAPACVGSLGSEMLGSLFCCPVTRVLMRDPVIAADGHTYERHAMQEWLTHRSSSPVTGLQLSHKRLISNVLIRSAIVSQFGIA